MIRTTSLGAWGCVLAAGASIAGCASPTLVGKNAPHFTLKDLAGQDVSLEDFNGKPVLLAFWAAG
jgi:hypothetical protein